MLNSNKPFRPPTKNQLAVRGLIFAGVVALVVGGIELQHNGAFGGAPTVTAEVRNAGGSLIPNSDVKDNGVIVGFVKGIEPGKNGLVNVKLAMNEGALHTVPSDVVARILPATVFGTSYVDLRSPSGSAKGGGLQDGATIPADATQGTLELQDALDDIDGLVKALSPAKLSSALGSIAVALDGRGEAIGNTAVELDNYLKVIQPVIPALQADIAKAASALTVINKIAPDLLNATDHGVNLLNTLVQHQGELNAVLTAGTNLSNTGSAFLAKNSADLTKFLHDLSGLTDALYDNRKVGITGLIRVNAVAGRVLAAVVQAGYVKIDATLTVSAPAGY